MVSGTVSPPPTVPVPQDRGRRLTPCLSREHTSTCRLIGGFGHFMFIAVNNDNKEINIEEEMRLKEESSLKEEVEEEPDLSRDGWGGPPRICRAC